MNEFLWNVKKKNFNKIRRAECRGNVPQPFVILSTLSYDCNYTTLWNMQVLFQRLHYFTGFLCWPWKVLEFQKTDKGLELFWKKSGRPWKVWNLSIVKVSTRLDDCVNCRSCCKADRRTAQTVLLINVAHQCFKSVRLFSWVSVGLYAIEWLTGRRALNWPWITEWKGSEKPWIL